MDKRTVYTGELVQSPDILQLQQNVEIALAFISDAVIGHNGEVRGLNIGPTSPVSASVQMAAGSMYQLTEADATPWSDLGTDTHTEVYQAIQRDPINLPTVYGAPSNPNQQIVYTLQGEIVQQDQNPTLLPFFDSANPTQPVYGAGGGLLNIDRKYIVNTDVLVGSTFTAPVVDAGDFIPVGNSPNIIQEAHNSADNVSSFTVTLPSTPAVGNSVYLLLASDAPANQATSITATGMTFTLVERHNTNSNVEIWHAENIGPTPGTVITVHTTAGPNAFIAFALEAFNVETSSSTDQFTGSSGTSVSPDSGTTGATAQADELFLAILQQTGAGQTFSAPTNLFTLADQLDDTGATIHAALLYKSVSVVGTANTTVTSSTSAAWEGAIATFKAAPGGGSLTPGVYRIQATYVYSGLLNGESQPSVELLVTIDVGNPTGSITYNIGSLPVGVIQANIYITSPDGAAGSERFSQLTNTGSGTITTIPLITAAKVPKHATAPNVLPGFVCLAYIAMSTGQTLVNSAQIFDCRPTFLTLPEIASIEAGTFVAGVSSLTATGGLLVDGIFGPVTGDVVIGHIEGHTPDDSGMNVDRVDDQHAQDIINNAVATVLPIVVDQIVAGTNVTISPPSGKGIVTVNALVPTLPPLVNQIIAGTGIAVSPPLGEGVVTVSISGSGFLTDNYTGIFHGSGLMSPTTPQFSTGPQSQPNIAPQPSGPFNFNNSIYAFYPLEGGFFDPAIFGIYAFQLSGGGGTFTPFPIPRDLRHNEGSLLMIAPKTGTAKFLFATFYGEVVASGQIFGQGSPATDMQVTFALRKNGVTVSPAITFQIITVINFNGSFGTAQTTLSLIGSTTLGSRAIWGYKRPISVNDYNGGALLTSISNDYLVLSNPAGGGGTFTEPTFGNPADSMFVPAGLIPTGNPNINFAPPGVGGFQAAFFIELQNLIETMSVNQGDVLDYLLTVTPANAMVNIGTIPVIANLRVGAFSIEIN